MHDLVNNFLSGVDLKILRHNLLPPERKKENAVRAHKKLSDAMKTILPVWELRSWENWQKIIEQKKKKNAAITFQPT